MIFVSGAILLYNQHEFFREILGQYKKKEAHHDPEYLTYREIHSHFQPIFS